jgi:hypothetical protein
MTKKQLYKMNCLAHPNRAKADFKAMTKKQLRNALRCRVLYLLSYEE